MEAKVFGAEGCRSGISYRAFGGPPKVSTEDAMVFGTRYFFCDNASTTASILYHNLYY